MRTGRLGTLMAASELSPQQTLAEPSSVVILISRRNHNTITLEGSIISELWVSFLVCVPEWATSLRHHTSTLEPRRHSRVRLTSRGTTAIDQ